MTDSYLELLDIWNSHKSSIPHRTESRVLCLLHSAGITIRRDDGRLRQMTLSRPTSAEDTLVIGLRYDKRNRTLTEDLFTVKRGFTIQPHYRGYLERQWPEYLGTHKKQVSYDVPLQLDMGITFCNTITFPTGGTPYCGSGFAG